MIIRDIFEKDINRDIKGVIKVGQDDETNVYQDLSEYVVTKELNKHFRDFFDMYQRSIEAPTDDMGVWISGFFGSGKSHFLKILSYLLDSDLMVNGKKPIDFFKEDNKITDSIVLANMENAANIPTYVSLFNIDSKNNSGNKVKDPILNVFYREFNKIRGYSEESIDMAFLEKELEYEGKYELFKEKFNQINGSLWEEKRDHSFFIREDIIETLASIWSITKDRAENLLNSLENQHMPSIEKFAKEVKEYLDKKGNNSRIVFLVDEIGQYIGDDTNLMLNLQTLTEELGTKCHGKAWIVVTSQEAIDNIVRVKGNDFSKIQGRFKTRISLTSSNVDEVIKKRILEKTENASDNLKLIYEKDESIIKNLLTFDNDAEMKLYIDSDDFSQVYPFIPYQFNLLQSVLNSIRTHGATGKHLAEGERSMLSLFQESAQKMEEDELGTIIPFDIFYNALEKFIDNSHSRVVNKARENELLTDFDVRVLKILFLIKYVKEINPNLNNLTTLMIDSLSVNRSPLKEKLIQSLVRLENQTLIQKNGDKYTFLTDAEQDINREIKNIIIETSEILNEEAKIIFEDIIEETKYQYNKRYNFKYTQSIDEVQYSHKQEEIGLRFITSYYDSNYSDLDSNQNLETNLREKSSSQKEAIFKLKNDSEILKEIEEVLQIRKYLRKNSSTNDKNIRTLLNIKSDESEEKRKRIVTFLEESIKTSEIFISGEHDKTILEKNSKERVDEALEKLVKKTFNKLSYMETSPDKNDIKHALEEDVVNVLSPKEIKNRNALNDLEDYIKRESEIHNKPSIKNIKIRYRKAPYGFINNDIEWLIAKLYSQKRISLIKNSETLTKSNSTTSDLFKYITDNKLSEKILIDKKKTISQTTINTVKNILDEVFHKSATTTDADYLKEIIKNEAKNKLHIIKEYLNKYNGEYNYPGFETVKKYEEYLIDLQNKSELFKFLTNTEDDLLDLNDQFEYISQFFKGEQSKIFKKATDTYKLYYNNRYLINNEELEKPAEEINEILQMENPFSNIPKLPDLIDKIKKGIKIKINEEKEIIKPILKEDEEELLNILTTDDLKEEFTSKIKNKYEYLNKQLESNNLAAIKGILEQNSNIKAQLQKEIREFIPKTHNPVSEPPTILPKSKDIKMESLLDVPRITITNAEDLDDFISDIKRKLEKELDNMEKININR